ncbi:hypothetical protein [Streptomyces sp. NPDC004682]
MNGTDLDRYITGNWGEDSVPPEHTMAESLEPGDVINVGDLTEEDVFLTVEYVTVRGNEVRISTKELAFDLIVNRGTQVDYGEM